MLQNIRDRAQGWFAAVLFGFLVLTFAVWGINFYLRAEGEVVVAKVNGQDIKLKQFERYYYDYRQHLQATQGGNARVNEMDPAQLRPQALQQMIESELLKQAASNAHLHVGDEQLALAIRQMAVFQRDSRFANDMYQQRLRDLGLSTTGFEEQMRSDLVMGQLQQGLAATEFVTQSELNGVMALKTQKRDLIYTMLTTEDVRKAIVPTDAELEAYYKAHGDHYMKPETVRIAYIDLDAEELAKAVAVDETQLKEYYEAHKVSYTTPEQRSVSHLTLHLARDAKPEEIEAAREKAQALLAEARAGKSFEDIAAAHEKDPGFKGEGGKTGFFRRGVMGKEYDEIAFKLKPGELGGPVRVDAGFQILRLDEIKPELARSFDEARADVEKAYRQEQAEKKYYELADQLSTLTYENADSLAPAAKALGLTVQESGALTRNPQPDQRGVLANPKVLEAAFSPEVLREGLNSKAIEILTTHSVVLRVVEHQPAAPRPLSEVRQEVTEAMIDDIARHKVMERGQALLGRLNEGEDRNAMAKSENLKWTEVKGAGRVDPDVNRAVARAAFKLAPPAAGQTAYTGVELGTGEYAVVGVSGVEEGNADKVPETDRKQTRLQLLDVLAQQDWKDYVAALKARAKVQTYPDKL
ncbi:MAG TPA: SurA N-terminal domain-containing protein [Gammaproteobacteria bacterium]|nr:SurA N-terminal domain-containing protein [Gammaproteobacteria bacterium]